MRKGVGENVCCRVKVWMKTCVRVWSEATYPRLKGIRRAKARTQLTIGGKVLRDAANTVQAHRHEGGEGAA